MKQIAPHGTPRRYRHGPDENGREDEGCRCNRCRAGVTRDMKRRRLAGPQTVEAAPVRRHVAELKAAGLPYKSIASIAGVQYMVMSRLLYGDAYRGQPPLRRMRASNAAALLAVRIEDVGGHGMVLAIGSQRRLQALACLGCSAVSIGREVGTSGDYIGKLMRGECGPTVTAATARAVAGAFSWMWMTDPVAAGIPQAARVRTLAIRRGWVSALAWDDIDNPNERPRGVCREAS